jgi:hypothetical protein
MINSIIPAATDDHPVVIPTFAKEDLVGLLLTADQDCIAKLFGLNHTTLAAPVEGLQVTTFTVAGDLATDPGTPGEFTTPGDLTGWLYPGDNLYITGATTAQFDGHATVMDVAHAAAVTTVGVSKDYINVNAAVAEVFTAATIPEAGVANTTVARKYQPLGPEVDVNGAAVNEFNAAGPPGVLVMPGDFSWLQEGDEILIDGATTHGNDGIWTVATAVYAAPDTTITLTALEAFAGAEGAAATTTFQWVRTHHLVRLTANEPYLWGIQDGSGVNSSGSPNPLIDDITTLTVTNEHATLTADFQARILTVPV